MVRVLLAEDEPDVRDTLVISFRMAGFEVDAVADGAQALAKLAACEYDVLVTDLWMPVIDGIGILKHLASHGPDVKVVAISGGSPGRAPVDFSVAVCETYGADLTFHKPFDNQDLIDAIKGLLA